MSKTKGPTNGQGPRKGKGPFNTLGPSKTSGPGKAPGYDKTPGSGKAPGSVKTPGYVKSNQAPGGSRGSGKTKGPGPSRPQPGVRAGESEDVLAGEEALDEKLQKVLARAGLGSRREMERAIEAGSVRVNNREAQLGDRVTPEDKIVYRGEAVQVRTQVARQRVILYNKPEGEICSRQDPEGRRTVFENLPKLQGERWISVGRLDFNTSGLLLFTNDGELANKLMHPSSVIDREYLVRIQGAVDDEMKRQLVEGVLLEDGVARFTDIVEGAGEGRNKWFYCVIMEGRNREVRRLWESQGVKVSRLKRVRYGNIFIPSHVRVGQWIELNDREVKDLMLTAGLEKPRVERLTPDEKKRMQRQEKRLRAGAAKRSMPPRGAARKKSPKDSD